QANAFRSFAPAPVIQQALTASQKRRLWRPTARRRCGAFTMQRTDPKFAQRMTYRIEVVSQRMIAKGALTSSITAGLRRRHGGLLRSPIDLQGHMANVRAAHWRHPAPRPQH